MAKQIKHSKIDSPLFIAVVVLCVVGIVMVYSASSFKAQQTYGDSNFFLMKHFYKVLAGFVLMLIVAQINYRFWLAISPALLFIAFLLLMYMLLSSDVHEIRGSKRWLSLGFIQFQPSDFARLALILFLGLSLGATQDVETRSLRNFVFHLALIIAIALPILIQPDLGSALLTMAIALIVLFVTGERLRHLTVLGLAGVGLLGFFILRGGYHLVRIKSFLSAIKGQEVAWQTQQSLIAFGSGHFFGLGLGSGRQKYHFLPDPFTDFVFSIFGEELGLIGTTFILVLFLILLWSGFKIALAAADFQGKVLGIGLVLNITIYAFTNMGVVLNLLPTTGVPIPFLSYGGSALFVNMFAVGVLLNISDNCGIPKNYRPRSRK